MLLCSLLNYLHLLVFGCGRLFRAKASPSSTAFNTDDSHRLLSTFAQPAVTMSGLSSIRTSGEKIEIVNQLLLPHTTEWVPVDTIEQAYDAIKSMKVCPLGSFATPDIAISLSSCIVYT